MPEHRSRPHLWRTGQSQSALGSQHPWLGAWTKTGGALDPFHAVRTANSLALPLSGAHVQHHTALNLAPVHAGKDVVDVVQLFGAHRGLDLAAGGKVE